jgi:hypothetical protein
MMPLSYSITGCPQMSLRLDVGQSWWQLSGIYCFVLSLKISDAIPPPEKLLILSHPVKASESTKGKLLPLYVISPAENSESLGWLIRTIEINSSHAVLEGPLQLVHN